MDGKARDHGAASEMMRQSMILTADDSVWFRAELLGQGAMQ
jgi:hypothetical protein